LHHCSHTLLMRCCVVCADALLHLQVLTGNDVSVFEMVTSGAVSRLAEYLQGKDLPEGLQKDEHLLCRLRSFTSVALAACDQQPDAAPDAAAGGGAAAAAAAAATSASLTALVRKLQGALASSEAFPVACPTGRLGAGGGGLGGSGRSLGRSAGMSGSFSRSTLNSGLHALTQPFKLRLVRHDQVGGEGDRLGHHRCHTHCFAPLITLRCPRLPLFCSALCFALPLRLAQTSICCAVIEAQRHAYTYGNA
jgi:hypothetical protein